MKQKKKLKLIYKFLIIFYSITFILGYFMLSLRCNTSEKYYLSLLQKSDVLKEEIGEIKSVHKKLLHFETSEGDTGYINLKVKTAQKETYNIKVILKDPFIICGYEIDGKMIYEDKVLE